LQGHQYEVGRAVNDGATSCSGDGADELSSLANDLRTPVQAIRSSLDALGRPTAASDEVRRHLDLIDRQVTRLGDLLDSYVDRPPVAAPRTSGPADHGATRSGATRSGGRRILVVDDHVDVAEALRDLLADQGHQVRAVTGGAEAVTACSEELPEMVLLDLGMPGLDGYATIDQLRDLPGGSALIVVALTGRGGEERRRTAAAGFDRHLMKPIDAATLETIVDSLPTPVGR
jgi:CheY-like chemotaxis protein